MPTDRKDRGNQAERLALNYLRQHGLELLASQFSTRWGEIDLIMRDRDSLVFVEVRYRRSLTHGHPLETITSAKQGRIRNAASLFAARPGMQDFTMRFDVVALSGDLAKPELEWIRAAFD